jgi:sugar lactone lactonase YvrE
MMTRAIFGSLLFAGLVAFGHHAVAAEPCTAKGNLHFVCGAMNAEDLVQVPGTDWIVASGFAGGGASVGHLYLVNVKDKLVRDLFPGASPAIRPDKANYGACPGAPDLAKFSTHGLNLRRSNNGVHTLYVVNHGGREAVEFFELDATQAQPTAVWVGCAVMPAHTWPNSVAPLPDGGMLVTSMFNPGDKAHASKLNAGENTGAIYEWHSSSGYKIVPGSEMSGNNGIEVSPDGKWIYVAAWGNKAVVRLSRGAEPAKRDQLEAGFLVDNLRRGSDGELLVTGQNVPAKEVFGCFETKQTRCTHPWRVVKWDTAAMKLKPVLSENGHPEFGDATVALRVGGEIFVGTFRGDRIAYLPAK